MLENLLNLIASLTGYNYLIEAWFCVMVRFFGFLMFAPIISRKDIPFMVKLAFSIIIAVTFTGMLSPQPPAGSHSFFLILILNFVFGSIIGFIARAIFIVISIAGDIINMQMGLSASMFFDPFTRQQTSTMGLFFDLLGTVIFINIGGLYWYFSAFKRSFDMFPIFETHIPINEVANLEYITSLTGGMLTIGLQLAAPVLIATLGQDVILGIISRTAPQINVFQLSFLFKPVVGIAIIIVLMPLFVNVITDYFIHYSNII